MKLFPQPLTAEAFAAFGDVIETVDAAAMNAGCFSRSVAKTTVDIELPGQARIDIVTCKQTTELPCTLEILECHPLGSQAFIPLSPFRFIVVVAAKSTPEEVYAFVTNGRQGINYHRGTWHMPMIGRAGQQFLLIERDGTESNCEVHRLPSLVTVAAPV